MGLSFVEPRTEADMADFDTLNWAYLEFLRVQPRPFRDYIDQVYSDEKFREALENRPRSPDGLMRLMLRGNQPAGCGTLQRLGPDVAEIKRVYITPEVRGTGAGQAIMDKLIADARDLGFARILMDTGKPLVAAQALYDKLGFRRRGPYQDVPPELAEALVYFEMPLR